MTLVEYKKKGLNVGYYCWNEGFLRLGNNSISGFIFCFCVKRFFRRMIMFE